LFVPTGGRPFPRELVNEPILSKAYKNWGRYGDIGFVALNDKTKAIIGAAWVRLYKESDPSFGFIDEKTPEMVISVKRKYHCKSIGTQLLENLIQTLKENGFIAISLSVDHRNPALKLYKRLGFEIIKNAEDESPVMLLKI